MTSKKKDLYTAAFQKIKSVLPEFNPTKAMGDFENASGSALQSTFPGVVIGGCQFHYSQGLWRRIQKLGLVPLFNENRQFKKWVKKIMALSYLPPQEIRGGADLLFSQNLDINQDSKERVARFKAYFYAYWLEKVTPEKLSVFDFARGTNNDSESYHSRIKSTVRQHKPNIYYFLNHINNIISDTNKDIERVDNGLQITRKQKKKSAANIERRKACKEKFINGTYTVAEYLNAIVYTFDTCVSEFRIPFEDEDDDVGQAQENEEEGGESQDQCGICVEEIQRKVAVIPCGHTAYCENCIAILRAAATEEEPPTCPSCRAVIQGTLAIHL